MHECLDQRVKAGRLTPGEAVTKRQSYEEDFQLFFALAGLQRSSQDPVHDKLARDHDIGFNRLLDARHARSPDTGC